jgi:serine/threonine protein kinase
LLCHQCGSPVAETDETCPNCGATLKKTARLEVKRGRGFKRFTSELKAISPADKRAFPMGEEIAGRFVLGEMIGRGPFGQVYEATDTEIDATVAIKVMRQELVASPIDHERFLGVANDARSINHKGLVRIHDSGVHRDAPWVSMQQLEGLSLRKVIKLRASKSEAFTLEEAGRLVNQLAETLEVLGKKHAHGDLKPDNVVFMPELIKATDHFIVASFSGSQRAKALSDDPFASPELKKASGKLSARADVYSVGSLLSQMLFGAPAPSDGEVPEELTKYAALCERARSEDPEDRFQDVAALAAAFDKLVSGVAVPPAPPSAPKAPPTPPTPPVGEGAKGDEGQEAEAPAEPPEAKASGAKAKASSKKGSKTKTSTKKSTGAKGKKKGDPPKAKKSPPAPPTPEAKEEVEPYEPTEDETETVELSRAKADGGVELQDLLTTEEVGRDKVKVGEVPELKAERTKTALTPTPPPPAKDADSKGGNTGLIVVGIVLALLVVGGLVMSNGSKQKEPVKLGDGSSGVATKDEAASTPEAKPDEAKPPEASTNNAAATPPASDTVAVGAAQGEASRDVEEGRAKAEQASAAQASALAVNAATPPTEDPAGVGTPGPTDSSKPPADTKVEPPKKDPPRDEIVKKDPPKKDPPKDVKTTNTSTGCPAGMVLLKSKKYGNSCVDRYEYPGKGAPKTRVSWFDAKKTCESQGKRLCGLSEWRRACGSKFPYGSKWDPNRCNTQDEDEFERSIGSVGAFKRCRSRSGAYDMVGNVHEWVLEKKIAGGAFDSGEDVASCRYSSSKGASSKAADVGFRCCADPR